MPDDGLQLIDVIEFETSQPDVTYGYVHQAYVGYQLRLSAPLRNYRFQAADGPPGRPSTALAGSVVRRSCPPLEQLRRPADQIRGPKWLWAPVVAVVNSAGVVPISYFVFGRRPPAQPG